MCISTIYTYLFVSKIYLYTCRQLIISFQDNILYTIENVSPSSGWRIFDINSQTGVISTMRTLADRTNFIYQVSLSLSLSLSLSKTYIWFIPFVAKHRSSVQEHSYSRGKYDCVYCRGKFAVYVCEQFMRSEQPYAYI